MNKKDYDAADRLVGRGDQAVPEPRARVLPARAGGARPVAMGRRRGGVRTRDRAVPGLDRRVQEPRHRQRGARPHRRRGARLRDGARARARPTTSCAPASASCCSGPGARRRGSPCSRELADRDTKNADVWIALARNSYDKGDYAGHRAGRSCARRRCADDGPAWFNLGVVRLRLDNRAGRAPGLRARRRPTPRPAIRRPRRSSGSRPRSERGLRRLRPSFKVDIPSDIRCT